MASIVMTYLHIKHMSNMFLMCSRHSPSYALDDDGTYELADENDNRNQIEASIPASITNLTTARTTDEYETTSEYLLHQQHIHSPSPSSFSSLVPTPPPPPTPVHSLPSTHPHQQHTPQDNQNNNLYNQQHNHFRLLHLFNRSNLEPLPSIEGNTDHKLATILITP